MLSISQNVRLCVRLSVCLSAHVFTYEAAFKRLFAPTSQSPMSKIFRDSEFLGESSGKKWSQIRTFLLNNGLKSLRREKILRIFLLPLFTFEVPFKHLFAPISQSPMSKKFRDSESLGKSNGKKWSQIWTFLLKKGLKWTRQRKKSWIFSFVHSI